MHFAALPRSQMQPIVQTVPVPAIVRELSDDKFPRQVVRGRVNPKGVLAQRWVIGGQLQTRVTVDRIGCHRPIRRSLDDLS